MSWSQRAYGRISPRFAHGPLSAPMTKFHAWLIRRTNGRIGTRFFGGAPLLVLRTTGRRSGQPRESPVIYVPAAGDAVAVCASNAASARFPAWWLNLQADPAAEVLLNRKWRPVRARKAEGEEAAQLLAKFEETYEGAKHYATIAQREMPVVVLEPR